MAASRAGALLVTFVVASFVGLSGPGVARAAEVADVVAGVRLAGPTCPIAPLPWPDFVEALRVELASRAPVAGATVVTLAIEPCDVGTTTIHVVVDETSRQVGLADVAPAARARALALVVAELVRGVPVAPPPPSPTSRPLAPGAGTEGTAAASPGPSRSEPHHATYSAEALGRVFPSRHTDQWGGRFAIGDEAAEGHWELFFEAVTGGRQVAEGDVAVRSFGAGYAVGPTTSLGRTKLKSALALSFDYTRVEGLAPASGVAARAGGGLSIALALRFAWALPLGAAWSLHAFAEPGYVLRHVDAEVDGAPAAGVRGPMISFGLGGAYGRP
jgi:hypothetical protein